MHRRLLRRLALASAALIIGGSCGDTITGPSKGRVSAPIVFRPQFLGDAAQAALASGINVASVRVTLSRADSTRAVVVNRVVTFTGTDSLVIVPLEVPLASASADGEPFLLTLAYAGAAGDTVFRGGPNLVTARPVGAPGAETPNEIATRYTGPGAQAVRVVLTPDSVDALALGSFSVSATALDAQGAVVSNAPIRLTTPDTNLIALTGGGAGVARGARGVGRIIATILTGAPDTSRVFVRLPASGIQAVSGGAQSGTVVAALANPIVVKVTAADGVPVAGVAVSFVPRPGSGTTAVASVPTDANGLASTAWTLGASAGAQSVVARIAGIADSVIFTATGVAGVATQLVFVTQPSASAAAGQPFGQQPVVAFRDANGNTATTATGAVTLALTTGTGTLSGTTTVNAIAGIASFGGLSIDLIGSDKRLTAASESLASVTSAQFSIVAGPAAALKFTTPPSSATVGVAITPAVVVGVTDAVGNDVSTYTGSVTVGLGANPGTATLGGRTTVTAVNGIATFDSLTISASAVGYTLVASASGLASVASPAFSVAPAVIRWVNPSGGSWWEPSNWDAGRVPASADSVVIALDGTYLVTVDSMAPVKSLVIGGATGTQSVQMVQNVGRTNLLSARDLVIGANAELQLLEVDQLGATSVRLDGTLLLAGVMVLNSPLTTGPTSRIRVVGGALGGASANPIFTQTLVNNGTIELVSTPVYSAQLVANQPGVENRAAGTIRATGAGYHNIVGRIVNDGTIIVEGNLAVSAPGFVVTNSGTITLIGGELSVNLGNGSEPGNDGTFTNAGLIAGDSSSSFRVDFGTTVLAATGTISGIGNVWLYSTNATLAHAPTTSLNLNASTAILDASLQAQNVALFSSSMNGPGTITVGTGRFLLLQNSTVNAGVALTGGRLTAAGTSTLGGALTVEPNAVLAVEGAATQDSALLTVASGFTNRGILSLVGVDSRSATLAITEGTLVNESGAAIFANGFGGSHAIRAPLENRGNVFANGDLLVSSFILPHVNNGLLRAISGSITLTGAGMENSGTISVDTLRSVRVEGGLLINSATGVITGAGSLHLLNVTAELDGTVQANLVASGSTITAAQILDLPRMDLSQASVTGAAVRVGPASQLILTNTELFSALQNDGLVTMSGTIALTGPVTTSASSQLHVNGGGLAGTSTVVSVAGGFTNLGVISLTSDAASSATLTLGADSLLNEVGGSILATGAGGSATLAATLVNRGQVTTDVPLLIDGFSGTPSSSGGLQVRGGTLEFHQGGTVAGLTLSGTVVVDSTATLVVNAGTLDLESTATVSGGGTFALQNANANIAANIGTRFTTLFGSISLNSTLSSPSVSFSGSGVSGSGVIQVPVGATLAALGTASVSNGIALGGTLLLAGTPTMTGAITTSATSHVRVVGGNFGATNTLATIATSFSNVGLLELEGIGSSAAELSLAGGNAFLNASGGTVRTLGSGGVRGITASTIENQGTIALSPGFGGDTLRLNGFFVGGGTSSLLLDVGVGGADQVAVTGQASLAGSLTLTAFGGFAPAPASALTLITSSLSRVGTFGTVALPPAFNQAPVYGSNAVTVTTP